MNFTLQVWRQKSAKDPGKLETYQAKNISPDASFLEMLDVVNNELEAGGQPAIAFEHDCREGICGSCGMMIDGLAHGPERGVTACQLYMRNFHDGATIVVEPFRARAFPVIKDLVVDRSAFDRIIRAGGFISVNVGNAQDGNNLPIPKADADKAFQAAACIGCGACVASCKNASAMLFTSAKISQLAPLPQGQPERRTRVINMVDVMDREGFGNCTNEGECEAKCPKSISLANIARMNREYLTATAFAERKADSHGGA